LTSQGSPYSTFKRALARGSLTQILAAAAELPHIALDDALAICAAMQGHEQADRAAVRWLARLALERPSVRLEDLRAGLAAFEAFPYNPHGARRALDELCRQHGVGALTRETIGNGGGVEG
jgi:hypothetical protein